LFAFGFSTPKFHFPFKLNSCWLLETNFSSIVTDVWNDTCFLTESCIQHRFIWKLKSLKGRIKIWATHLKKQNTQRLLDIETDIQTIHIAAARVGDLGNNSDVLKDLESERNQLLLKDELTWRQRL
jgi:hypothetical protein